jgi:tRNA-binding protein
VAESVDDHAAAREGGCSLPIARKPLGVATIVWMYVPVTGWHGEQKPGAFVGTPSISTGCSTRAGTQPAAAERGGAVEGSELDPSTAAVGDAVGAVCPEHAATTQQTATAAAHRTPRFRIRIIERKLGQRRRSHSLRTSVCRRMSPPARSVEGRYRTGIVASEGRAVKDIAPFSSFEELDIRVGRVLAVEDSLSRKPTYRLTIDFGPELGVKRSVGAYRKYAREELVGRQIVAVVNFGPKKMGPEISEVLVLGVDNTEGQVVFLTPESEVPLGHHIY